MSLKRSEPPPVPRRRFLSVTETASLFGTSEMTVYRAIAAGELPAVRLRGRLIIPRQAIDELERRALDAAAEAAGSDAVAGRQL
jgi:excisionase family DNA binding protein